MTTAQRRPARRVRPFTPSQESPALLSDRTVGRDAILSTLDQRLLDAATSANRAHTLLIGPRGAGKTHLLNVAIYRARQRTEVAGRLAFVRFDEDAVGISRYTDVLDEVLAKLSPFGRRVVIDQPEAMVREALNGRVLVLVIENLDRVFQALGKSGQQDFRAWVETSGQVLVLATAPLLFPGVRDRAMPWWGNFGIAHLDELDLAQGQQLLTRLARESGDLPLVDYLGTDEGLARLRAINDLAGGSPRIWMILAECLTVELLDELVPLVEALLEGLVPYYQQLLWDLSPVEQRLVRILADGAHQAATVSELATAAGIGQRVAATTLGRLADIRWVRAEKPPELDQRSTWYRLQEPMVRHHFHYRSATDQPLPLIVEILRAWYSPAERRSQLAIAEPGSAVERFAAATFADLGTFGSAYSDRDIPRLQAEARTWVYGGAASTRTVDAGILIDLAVTATQLGATESKQTLGSRHLDEATMIVATDIVARAANQDPTRSVSDRAGELFRLAANGAAGRSQLVLELVSACWDGPSAPETARDRLADLVPLTDLADPLGLDVRSELAYWLGEAGDVAAAVDQLMELVPVCERVLGAEHRDTLFVRANLAYCLGEAGDVVAGRDQYAALIPLYERVLGSAHSDTITTRLGAAFWTGVAGDAASARDQFAALVPEYERLLGDEHPTTVAVRLGVAYWTGLAGDAASARDQIATLVPVRERVLGVDHPDTLAARNNLAYWTGEAGDVVGACELAGQLLTSYSSRSEAGLNDGRAAAAGTLVRNLERVLNAEGSAGNQTGEIADLGVVGLLQAALNGSAEALVRLPSELVPIVETLRAQRSGNLSKPEPA
jgi:hypothetical protein